METVFMEKHIPDKNCRKGAHNQAKYWQKNRNLNHATSSDPHELVVDINLPFLVKSKGEIILEKINLIFHVNYRSLAW